MFCLYYLVHIKRERAWFVAATFKSFEHLCFDRTLDKTNSIFEFFVPKDNEYIFLEIVEYFVSIELIDKYYKLENRLIDQNFNQ